MANLARRIVMIAGCLALLGTAPAHAATAKAPRWDSKAEEYVPEPLPRGISVVNTELEGPVFANAAGRTLYTWPGNGANGDAPGKPPLCDETRHTRTTEAMVPYPAGLELPESATRPSCAEVWPAAAPSAGAKAVGNWTIVARKDGTSQWAYKGLPVYTSVLDEQPGETWGARKFGPRRGMALGANERRVIGPAPLVPGRFRIRMTARGHLLTLDNGFSVYTHDSAAPGAQDCAGPCADEWEPILAPETVVPGGDWSVIERSPGVFQWAFRKWPLYRRLADKAAFAQTGSDVPGWHNVYTHLAPPPPAGFAEQDTRGGVVLADDKGRTIYTYTCIDPAPDRQSCDTPRAPQVYRLAVCGNFDAAQCQRLFPYLTAQPRARATGKAWSLRKIDPATGRWAAPGQKDALVVWAWRGRPVYRNTRDTRPGDIEGDTWGDATGSGPTNSGGRNWFKAMWLRDDFLDNAE